VGTITIQANANRAWVILNDTAGSGGVRWPAAQMLTWHNDGQREVVLNLPSAYVVTATPTTVAGTRQTFAGLGITNGLQPISVVRNYDSAGVSPGRAITPRPKAWLDEQRPDWHSDPGGEAIHWFFDKDDPKTFYLWPRSDGARKIELVYSAVPPEATDIAQTIAIDDIYSNALQYYMLFRALAKNANYTKNPGQSQMYYQLFLQSLGIKDARVKALDANLQMLQDGAGVAGPGG
jgi:hypothetical protein